MKYESLLLRAMFVVCMLLCFATLGSMLFPAQRNASPAVVKTQLEAAVNQANALAPLGCHLDQEGAPCTRLD